MSLLRRLGRLESRGTALLLAMPELLAESADCIAFRWKLNGEPFGDTCRFERSNSETLDDFQRRASSEFSASHVADLPRGTIAIDYEDIGL